MRIHRRDFVRLAGLGMAAGSTAVQAATPDMSQSSSRDRNARTSAKALMKVGTQHDSSDEVLAVLAAFGVTNICSRGGAITDIAFARGCQINAVAGRALKQSSAAD